MQERNSKVENFVGYGQVPDDVMYEIVRFAKEHRINIRLTDYENELSYQINPECSFTILSSCQRYPKEINEIKQIIRSKTKEAFIELRKLATHKLLQLAQEEIKELENKWRLD